jgi:hypothetical protein
MPGQQRPQRNNEKPNGKTTTAITPGHHRAPHEAEFRSQPPLPSADYSRLFVLRCQRRAGRRSASWGSLSLGSWSAVGPVRSDGKLDQAAMESRL